MILAGNSFSAYCKTPLHSTPCDGMGCVRALGVRGFRTLSSQSHLTKPNRGVSLAVHSCRIYRRILPPGGCPSPNLASLLYLNLALSSWKPESAEHRALLHLLNNRGKKKKKTTFGSLGVAAAETVGIASHSAHPFGDNGGGGASIANRIRLSSSSSFPASILSVSRYLIFFLSGLGGLEQ